jgi:hypothetical protein
MIVTKSRKERHVAFEYRILSMSSILRLKFTFHIFGGAQISEALKMDTEARIN